MRILKKVNNNIGLALNKKNENIFVVGKGLGFRKTPYDIDENDPIIEKIFVAPKNFQLYDMLDNIPSEIICLGESIIEAGKCILNKPVNDSMLLPLCDHLTYAIERSRNQVMIKNPLKWEIKRMYPKEMKVGLKALDMIKEEFNVDLPDVEATFIALHFVNGQLNDCDISDTVRVTEIASDILSIVKHHYHLDLDEESLNLERFIIHLQYLLMRLHNGAALEGKNENIYQLLKATQTKEVECVEKINKFLNQNYQWNCSDEEKFYLILHLQRLTSRID